MSEDPTRLLPNDDTKVVLTRLESMMVARFDSLDAQVAELKERQTALEEKVDRRLQETRPIWEAVLAQLKKLEERMSELEAEQKEVRRAFFYNTKQFTRMNDELLERIEKLEERDRLHPLS